MSKINLLCQMNMLVERDLLHNGAHTMPFCWIFVHLIDHELFLYGMRHGLGGRATTHETQFFSSPFHR